MLSPLSSTLRRAPRPVASSASEFARLAQYTPLTKRVSLAASTKFPSRFLEFRLRTFLS